MQYTATYSPEDNKLRLYASQRLDAETYAEAKALGFKWAPVQKLFVAPAWSPEREDFCAKLAGDIEPEAMSLAERAEMKAERLDALAEKRRADSNAFARAASQYSERFANGQPILMGHHSQRSAERDRERAESATRRAIRCADLVNYWLYRAEGVECHANMKNCERTRRNRIKTLLAELRTLQRGINDAHKAREFWEKVKAKNPTTESVHDIAGRLPPYLTGTIAEWYELEKGELSGADYIARRIEQAQTTINGPKRARWIEHVLNRLAYERAELGETPRFGGELMPVILQAFAREQGAEKPKAEASDFGFILSSPVPLPRHIADSVEIELDDDGWRDLMQGAGHVVAEIERRPARKSASTALPLINPSQEEAERLQALWNSRAVSDGIRVKTYQPEKRENRPQSAPQSVISANSKGSYAVIDTVPVDSFGQIVRAHPHASYKVQQEHIAANAVARVRRGRLLQMGGAPSVVRVSDKPSKPLPVDWQGAEAAAAEYRAECEAVAGKAVA